jgi:2,4-dienoyl-CoA reductase-like NADH-dependent reductase (Old Yellow Enzyme family)
MSALFSEGQLGGLKLANRIAVSPMCQYMARQGAANSWHTVHLGSLALSGAAALFIEATAVEAVGRITPSDLGLWDDDTESALRRTLSAVRDDAIGIATCARRAQGLESSALGGRTVDSRFFSARMGN